MHFCCPASRAAAHRVFADMEARVERGERDGFDAKELARVQLLFDDWMRLAAGFCHEHTPLPPTTPTE